MYVSGLIHRDRLFDIASRWLADNARSEDGRLITEVFAFERMITAPVVRHLVADLWRAVGCKDLYLERVTSKDAVREAIAAAAAHPSDRVAELLDWYHQLPEEFFPRTPVQMSIVTKQNGTLAALVRRKLIRRITDKVCRKVAQQLSGEVAVLAERLAHSRPHGADEVAELEGVPAGVPGAAERLLAERIRSGRKVLDPGSHRVDDAIGVKIIGTEHELVRVAAALESLEHGRVHTREVHEGRYSATHCLVDVDLPAKGTIIDGAAGIDWSFVAGRGLDPADLAPAFAAYVESAERTFRVEIILTTFDDLVESEFGDSIHEQRILDQRFRASDYGRLANNGAWIIEYLLSLAVSPTVEVGELPIKLWGRYIRDTVALAIARLHAIEPVAWPIPREAELQGAAILPL